MYVRERRTVYALTRGLFLCSFPELHSNEVNKQRETPELVHTML